MLSTGNEGIRKERLHEVESSGVERGDWEIGFGGGEGGEQQLLTYLLPCPTCGGNVPRDCLLGIASEIKQWLA